MRHLHSMPQWWQRRRTAIVGTVVLLTIFFLTSSLGRNSVKDVIDGELTLPEVYTTDADEGFGVCAERYGIEYLQKFVTSATDMCEGSSAANLTCFTHNAWDSKDQEDTFCTGTPARIDPATKSVFLDCYLRNLTESKLETHAQMVDKIPGSWYDTGPRHIFDKYMHLSTKLEEETTMSNQPPSRVSLLVKREGGNVIGNAWHVLMQMMSLWLSLDVMRIAVDPSTGRPYYGDQDVGNTQVIILDEDPEGPFYDLWNMFGGLPTVRLRDSPPLASSKIVIPLPGGTNPIWQSRTALLPCDDSVLLRAFVKRILNFYKHPFPVAPKKESKTKMLFIDRTTKRFLVDQAALLTSLRQLLSEKYPTIELDVVDFENVGGLSEQIQKIQQTNILVGVHGAGLTHTLFLPPGSTVVEIQPPGLEYFGFETLARFLGHGYFQEYGHQQEYDGMKHNWQFDNVFISEEKFLKVIEQAINLREWRDNPEERRLGFHPTS